MKKNHLLFCSLVLSILFVSSLNPLLTLAEEDTTTNSVTEHTTTEATFASETELEPSTTELSTSTEPQAESSTEDIKTEETTEEEEELEAEEEAATASVPIYRLYNPSIGKHLYTTDANEKKVLYEQHGWGYEGIGWYAPKKGKPVYRLYNPGLKNHLYTTDTNEVNILTSHHGWLSDNRGKPVFYSGGKVNIYRLYNFGLSGRHHWTTDTNEYKVLPRHGWTQEGIKFAALQVGKPIQTQYYNKKMNISEIQQGNYSSITGWWKNGYGLIINISTKTVKLNNSRYYSFKSISPSPDNQYLQAYLLPYGQTKNSILGTGAYLVPRNVKIPKMGMYDDASDINKDRIIFGGQGVPSIDDPKAYYYYIGENISY